MTLKEKEKQKAVALRKQGKTYNEILRIVPVSKSTLSLWLRDVGLGQKQKQRLTDKKRAAQLRGAARKREIRIAETEKINKMCKEDISHLTDRELFFIGIALYWAEGAKKSADRTGIMVDFGNSDPHMLKLFIAWLYKFTEVCEQDIVLRLHLHENHKSREKKIIKIWSDALSIPANSFGRTIYKKHNPKTVRKKVDDSYIGLVSV